MKLILARVIGAALLAANGLAAAAPAFPSRPVTIIVPYAPGGITDGLGRLVAARLAEKWKQPVIVNNRSGGGTVIGTKEAASAQPDGHTMLLTSFGYVMNQVLRKSLPYEPNALAPLNLVGLSPNVLYLHPTVPVSNVQELIAFAKANPGKLTFASSGNASSPHVAAELFGSLTGTSVVHVAYRGTGPAMQDVLGGQVSGIFDTMQAMPHVKAGKLKAVAVANGERLIGAKELPTFKEAGLPGMITSSWFGFLTASGTPEPVRKQLFDDIQAVLKEPGVRSKIVQLGVEPALLSQGEFQRFLETEVSRWTELSKTRNITLD